jgi:hypothetical protein
MSVTQFMQPNLSRKFASVLRSNSHTNGALLPSERTEIPHLPATRTEWRLSSDRRAFTGSSIPECPNSVRVTFSRRSPQWRPLDLRNPVQSREKRAWNSSRRSHVRSCKRSHIYRSHQRSGSNRREEHSPALPELTQMEYPHPRRP